MNPKIINLNLTNIKNKIMHSSGEIWSLEKTNQAEIEYKKFLHIAEKNPNVNIGLTVLADKFWHWHILDTAQYMKDCNEIFGHYLHHNPNLLDETSDLHKDSVNNFVKFYNEEFSINKDTELAMSGLTNQKTELAMSGLTNQKTEFAMSGLTNQKTEFAMSGLTPV